MGVTARFSRGLTAPELPARGASPRVLIGGVGTSTRRRDLFPPDRLLQARMGLAILVQVALLAACLAGLVWLVVQPDGWSFGILMLFIVIAGARAPARSDKRATRRSRKARPVRPADEARVREPLRRLALFGGLKAPTIDVHRARLPLTWTTASVSGGRPCLHVTTGLLDRVDDRELEAVVAHELGHLANRDAVLMTALAGPPAWVFGGLRVMWDDDGRGKLGAVMFGIVLVPIAALMSVSARIVSRHRELAADRAAAVLTGSPARVAAALTNVAEGLRRQPQKDLRAVAARDPLHLLPAREATGIPRLWATHPPLAGRIARLERMERALQNS